MQMIGYLRCSTEEQAASGLGIEAQREAMESAATRRGWSVEWIADEGASGKSINPGLRRALHQCETGQAEGIVVAKMDRLARSVIHAADILAAAKAQGWNLVVLDLGVDLQTPQGKAMAQMMAVFAELERELIGQRTREALAARKAQGLPIGRPRLASASVVRRIVTEREHGRSYRAIAADLSTSGVLSPAGSTVWQESSVRRIFHSTQRAGR